MQNRKIQKSLLIFFVVLIFTPFIQGGCAGGGGGSDSSGFGAVPIGTLDVSTSSDSTKLLSALSSVYTGLVAAGSSTGPAIESLSSDHAPTTIFDALENIIDRMANEVQKGDVQALATAPPKDLSNVLCESGEAIVSRDWDDFADGCLDKRNFHMTVSMDSCVNDVGDTMTGTMEVTVPGSSCVLVNGNPADMDIVLDMILVKASNNSTIDFISFPIQISNLLWDPEEDIERMVALLDGTLIIEGERVSFYDFRLDVIDDLSDQAASSVTMNGDIDSPCIEGLMKVTTQEAVHFPDDFSCPDGGQYTFGHSNSSAVVTIHSDTSIDISMDGEVVHSYRSCDDPRIPDCQE